MKNLYRVTFISHYRKSDAPYWKSESTELSLNVVASDVMDAIRKVNASTDEYRDEELPTLRIESNTFREVKAIMRVDLSM